MSKALLRYVGGKSFFVDWILKHLDFTREVYVELFFGGGSILWNKKRHEVEIINDIDDELGNFLKVLSDEKKVNELKELLSKWLHCESWFYELRDMDISDKDEVFRAARFFYLNRCSVNGDRKSFGWSVLKDKAMEYANKVNELMWFHERLRCVQILGRDFRDVLKDLMKRDVRKICLYADPPYWGLRYYRFNFDEKDHVELAQMLNEFVSRGGYAVVSYYYFDRVEELYPKDKWIYRFYRGVKHAQVVVNKSNKSKDHSEELLLIGGSGLFI